MSDLADLADVIRATTVSRDLHFDARVLAQAILDAGWERPRVVFLPHVKSDAVGRILPTLEGDVVPEGETRVRFDDGPIYNVPTNDLRRLS